MLNIILFQPEIPQNTGNISRTCVGFNCNLHLIKPYGFLLNDQSVKRAGVDYWDKLKLFEYDSFEDFLSKNEIKDNLYIITRHGKVTPDKIEYPKSNEDLYLMFGRESCGLPEEIMKKYLHKSIRIPSINVRSLNLSNCVAIFAYLYAQHTNFDGLDTQETIKKIY